MSIISAGDIFICNIKDEIFNSSENTILLTKYIVTDEKGNIIKEINYSDYIILQGGKRHIESYNVKEPFEKLSLTWTYNHNGTEYSCRGYINLPNNTEP